MPKAKEPKLPTFIGGPRDGGLVPEALWLLDQLKLPTEVEGAMFRYALYTVDEATHNYIYGGDFIIPKGKNYE